jgi:hypothetical protein
MDWDNFSCVDIQRRIRSEIAAERGDMPVVEYLRRKDTQTQRAKETPKGRLHEGRFCIYER